MDRNVQAVQHGLPVSVRDAAHANEYFEQFVNATSLKNILGYYRGLIDCLHLRPNVFPLFYPKLKANLVSWRAKALLKKFDTRASHKCYQKGKLASNTKVLVIGGGPCGMRTAIEAQLLGAKVVVIEKRDRFSRNNVLHLWPFVIEDLRMLGAKKFFGKFCAGAIDHVSIRQLQCILLKVALLLGVEVHTEVSFEALIEPSATDKIGWRAQCKPSNHPVSQYEFDVVIGADGKRNTLQGFTRKEFRGKLAIAITANFINRKTEAEARVEEISGVAFIFNQKFFKDLQEATRIDLENIVYYKDDTHYFVMTAKKHSLIEKGVIKQDYADTEKLLAPENVDKEALQQYAIEAANFSTNYQLPNLEFAVNHYGQPDIAMFDFTSMYAAENASKVVERNGYSLLKILVGDSLLEPFWPTGSGCARGFLSSLDAAWAIRSWALGNYSPLEVLAERESIYRLLAQTTPDNLNKDWKSYTLDPSTRYPNLNKGVVMPNQVIYLFDTDNPASIERMKRTSNEKPAEIPKKRRRGAVDNEILLNWLTEQLKDIEDVKINDMNLIFKDGKVLCAIIHHYRPDLLDYGAIKHNDPATNNQIAIDILEKELGIPPVMTGNELTVTEDYLTMASYLTEVYDCFRGEIPHVKHPKLHCHKFSRVPYINCPLQLNEKRSPCKKCFVAFNSEMTSLSNNQNNCDVLGKPKLSTIPLTTEHNLQKKSSKKQVEGLTDASPEVANCNVGSIPKKSTFKLKKKTKILPKLKKKTLDYFSSNSDGHIHLEYRKKKSFVNIKQFNEKGLPNRNKKCSKLLSPFTLKKKIMYPQKDSVLNVLESKMESAEIINNKEYDKINNVECKNKENKHIRGQTKESNSKVIKNAKEIDKINVEFNVKENKHIRGEIKESNNKIIKNAKEIDKINNVECNVKENKYIRGEIKESNNKVIKNTKESLCKTSNKDMGDTVKINNKQLLKSLELNSDIKELTDKKTSEYIKNHQHGVTLLRNKNSKKKLFKIKKIKSVGSYVKKAEEEKSKKLKSKAEKIRKPSTSIQLAKQLDYTLTKKDVYINTVKPVKKRTNENQPIGLIFNNVNFGKECSSKTVEPPEKMCRYRIRKNRIKIRVMEKNRDAFTMQTIEYHSPINFVKISSKMSIPEKAYHSKNFVSKQKFLYCNQNKLHQPIKKSNNLHYDVENRYCDIQSESYRNKLVSKIMFDKDETNNQIFSKVSRWITSNDFLNKEDTNMISDVDTISNSKNTDITSVSKMDYTGIVVEERTKVLSLVTNANERVVSKKTEECRERMRNPDCNSVIAMLKYSPYSPYNKMNAINAVETTSSLYPNIEGEQETTLEDENFNELPIMNKKSELSFKTIKTSAAPVTILPNRPSSRHKHKHVDQFSQKANNSIDRKPRKRRTLEKVGASVEERQNMLEEIAANRAERYNKRRIQRKLQTEQFLKSMQMLQANAKSDSQPFEDYSIFLYRQTAPKFEDRVKDLEKQFTYVPDHESKNTQLSSRGGGKDEDIAAKIKNLESKWRQPQPVEKKPKDLMRAIGKIETSDWNIKEIEKKILENKMGKPSKAIDKEKVPKWSKEQFLARQTKMEKKHLDRQNSEEAKFADIDKSIKNLDQKIKEGTIREQGQKKVATITEKLVKNIPAEVKPPERTNRQPMLPPQNASQFCHFCNKRVYLMERLSAEGRFFHHGCFKCQYCHVQLRLGSYIFDRDGLYGYRFFCLQHFGMMGEMPTTRVTRKPSTRRTERSSPEKKPLPGITGVDLLDKVQTPERIEFSNLSSGHVSSDQEDSHNQIDEDEWTDKNFGASCAELDDTDDDSSSLSDTDSDDEAFDDALEQPPTKEGTLRWAERWKNSYRRKRNSESDEYSSSDQSSYYDSSDGDESETATEGEKEILARELRKKEVCVEPPIVHTDTGTDTEIVSDESSSESSSEIQNSATEISTDSEFAQDDPTPTREIPSIILNDFNVNKTRGSGNLPKKIQVTSRYLQKPSDGKAKKPNIELKLSPLVLSAHPIKTPAPISLTRPEGYSLNRTQSTGGIAAKVSLELKKKYLLGETNPGSIQKSGSASTLDTKFKSFHTNITDCQKMLKPSPEISASMQTFCKKLNELKSPVLSPQPSIIFTKELEPEIKEEKKEEGVADQIDETEKEKTEQPIFQNESEGRPRSPLHETSIIVPQIDWSKQTNSLTSDSLASSDSDKEECSKSKLLENIPRVEVYTVADEEKIKDDFVPDSLICVNDVKIPQTDVPSNESLKSIVSEKKTLNQPKVLPNLENLLPEIHNSLHIKYKSVEKTRKQVPEGIVSSSGLSSPESVAEQMTTALTETELSDWAQDEVVSDDFEEGEFEIHIRYPEDSKPAKMADLLEFEDSISSRHFSEAKNNALSVNLDNIEFMDTGTETSSEDGLVNSQNGYVLFKNEDDFAEDSLNPNINDIVEASNVNILPEAKIDEKIESEVKRLEVHPIKNVNDHEDDISAQIVESGTTTEENTFTESTVKNAIHDEMNDKNEIVKEKENIDNNIEFHEHCRRLQSKIEFSNVKDSIDVRKSRRKSKPDVLQKPDLITEEIPISTPPKNVSLNLTSVPHTPDILYNKEVIKKERDINQKLIQEMVMNKMKAENKSLERKKRSKVTITSKSPNEITKSATTTNVPQNTTEENKSKRSLFSSTNTTPDVLLSTNYPLNNSKTANIEFIQSEAKFSIPKSRNSDQFLLSTPNKSIMESINDTPKAPPRLNKSTEEMNRKLEKLKQTVKSRNKENEQKQEKLNPNVSFRRCVSGNYELSNPALSISDENSLSSRAKSIPDFPQQIAIVQPISLDPERIKVYKSDPNILETNVGKSKKKSKDRERRKSITKLIADFFTRKSPSSSVSKGLFGKLSPKSKQTSKGLVIHDVPQRKCLSESFIDRNTTPPPVPPLPINYVRKTDESSDGEDHKKPNHSSCDTLDTTGISTGSMSGRRSSKSRRISRQAQLKRHRMAQEIQRKLEETEVKMKELEDRGVMVEKALRGESSGDSSKDEAELLQEWFDLMRDRTELRRYERELTVRAQELELEDRHSRLQQELRERIENEKPKTKEDIDVEESIINEMIKIVEKRDSLIAEIEEDRLRYSNEDRDLEEQMLAKGLRLTPIKNSPEH